MRRLVGRIIVILASALLLVRGAALAAGIHTPRPGSVERKQIIAALRRVVERELARPVRFRIDAIRVSDRWAFLRGVPLEKSGTRMDYRGTPYQSRIEAGTFDDWICALLQKDGQRWRVVEHELGATDAPFVDWAARHRAPVEIFK